MASSVGAGRTRTVAWVVFAVATIALLIDSGSCALARIQVDDDAKMAARIAAQAIAGQPVNQTTAEAAYVAAKSGLPNKVETVVRDSLTDTQDFRVGSDGSVTLTVQRPAPTLLFKHLPRLKDYTTASVTVTQNPIGY